MTTTTKFKPMFDKILVERTEEKTPSGIIIPDTAKDKPSRGTVISTSDKVKSLKEGDLVVFGRFAGIEVKLDGKPFLILREEEVMGLVHE